MRRICVFCGSSNGSEPRYAAAARDMGKEIAQAGLEVVYGGGHVGLMGIVADAALAAGGKVTGVIPQTLVERELGHDTLTELRVVKSMHERKAIMADLSDAFIALPGGFGTLEEFCEMLTWSQLGFHQKPCGLLNVDGYYDDLIKFFDQAVRMQFLLERHRNLILVSKHPADLLQSIKTYQHTAEHKWLDKASL